MEEEEVEARRQTLLSRKQELAQLARDSRESTDTVVLDQSKVGRLSRMDALHDLHGRLTPRASRKK